MRIKFKISCTMDAKRFMELARVVTEGYAVPTFGMSQQHIEADRALQELVSALRQDLKS